LTTAWISDYDLVGDYESIKTEGRLATMKERHSFGLGLDDSNSLR